MKRILIILFFICSFANAATFNKNGYSNFTHAGSTGSYGISYGSTGAPGTIVSPNVGWLPVAQSAAGLTVQKLEKIPFPVGKTLDVNAKVVASPKNLAKALFNPWGMVASMALQETLGYLADQACVRISGGQMTNTGGLWEECIIRDRADAFFRVNQDDSTISTNMLVACSHWASSQGVYISTPVQVVGDYTGIPSSASGNWSSDGMPSCLFKYQTTFNGEPIGSEYPRSARLEIKIATGVERTEWQPADPISAQSKIEQAIIANPNLQPSIFNHVTNSGSSIEVSDPTITGPASGAAGNPVTTVKTNPDGSTITTTEQKTNNYSYSANTVTITSTTITNVSNNNTTNETTTTTTEKPTELTEDFCKSNPEVIACKKLEFDTPEGEIPRRTFDLTYSEESFLDGGACPADVYVQVRGQQVKAIDWQSHCSRITTYVRPLVILLSGFIALLILIPGGREVAS